MQLKVHLTDTPIIPFIESYLYIDMPTKIGNHLWVIQYKVPNIDAGFAYLCWESQGVDLHRAEGSGLPAGMVLK